MMIWVSVIYLLLFFRSIWLRSVWNIIRLNFRYFSHEFKRVEWECRFSLVRSPAGKTGWCVVRLSLMRSRDILRDFLEIPDLRSSPDSYNSKLEDDLFRWQILLDMFTDAAKYALKIGFSSYQMMTWLIILKESHDLYISNISLFTIESIQEHDGFGALKCMDIFKSNLLKHSKGSKRVFLKDDFERMIYYYRSTYLIHVINNNQVCSAD